MFTKKIRCAKTFLLMTANDPPCNVTSSNIPLVSLHPKSMLSGNSHAV